LSEGSLANEKCLFVLRCVAAYDKKMLILHVRESCPFPKFEEQPQEFREVALMEDVYSFSIETSQKDLKEIDTKLQLVHLFSHFSFQ